MVRLSKLGHGFTSGRSLGRRLGAHHRHAPTYDYAGSDPLVCFPHLAIYSVPSRRRGHSMYLAQFDHSIAPITQFGWNVILVRSDSDDTKKLPPRAPG